MTTTPTALQPVAVLGSGGWGTALAVHLGGLGKEVRLWGRNPDLVAEMLAKRENRIYLPAVELPPSVHPTSSLNEALSGARCVVLAVPSHGTRDVLRRAAPAITDRTVIVSATTGRGDASADDRGDRAGTEIVTVRDGALRTKFFEGIRPKATNRCLCGRALWDNG